MEVFFFTVLFFLFIYSIFHCIIQAYEDWKEKHENEQQEGSYWYNVAYTFVVIFFVICLSELVYYLFFV